MLVTARENKNISAEIEVTDNIKPIKKIKHPVMNIFLQPNLLQI